jgi:hypothetical protein
VFLFFQLPSLALQNGVLALNRLSLCAQASGSVCTPSWLSRSMLKGCLVTQANTLAAFESSTPTQEFMDIPHNVYQKTSIQCIIANATTISLIVQE